MLNNILTMILIVVNILVILLTFLKKKKSVNTVASYDTIFDATQDYMQQINLFIRREFLFELKKWISSSKGNIDISASGFQIKFYNDITDPNILQPKLSKITAVIISKMSTDLVNAFYRIYSRSFTYYNDSNLSFDSKESMNGHGDSLYMYVARALSLYLDRVITELVVLQDSNPDNKLSENIDSYIIEINNEIYMLNDIYVIGPHKEDTIYSKEK